MPEYLTPGVYVEEIEIGPKSIQGVSTSTAGFLGIAERGPVRPRLVTSFANFQRIYGAYLEDSYLAYAIDGFFRNGGQRCFVARIASKNDAIASFDVSADTTKTLRIKAVGPGEWGNRIHFKIEDASSGNPDLFKLTVIYFSKMNEPTDTDRLTGKFGDGEFTPDPSHRLSKALIKKKELSEIEVYDDLSIDPKSSNYYRKKVNGVSNLVVALDDISPADTPVRPRSTLIKIFEWEKINQGSGGGDPDHVEALKKFLTWNFESLVDWINGVDPVRSDDDTSVSFTLDPMKSVTIDRSNGIATLKINGRNYYSFVVEKDATGTVHTVYTSNIVSLSNSGATPSGTIVTDTEPDLSDYQGSKGPAEDPYGPLDNTDLVEGTGLKGFEDVDEISIVCAPNEEDISGLRAELIDHCETLKDRFAILQEEQQKAYSIEGVVVERESKYAATYLPWIKVIDPLTKSEKLIPPGGHIAGIYARSDIERGVQKAPANEPVRGATALQVQLTKEDQAILNPRGINVIRSFIGRGILVWGARTISADPDWIYINVRRLFLYIEESIEESTQWLVFEPNSERLWSRVIATLTPFLSRLRKEGALMGTTDEEAFFIRCDRTTMTQDDIDNGRLIVVIGVAPVKPAEFVIFRIAQTKVGATIEEF